jgi:hypothetical protein
MVLTIRASEGVKIMEIIWALSGLEIEDQED